MSRHEQQPSPWRTPPGEHPLSGPRPPFYDELDHGIRLAVLILWAEGVETCQSCEGGAGHSYPEPTVEFYGKQYEGFRAVAVALAYALPVHELRRVWSVQDGEPVGPHWAMTFWAKRLGEMTAAVTPTTVDDITETSRRHYNDDQEHGTCEEGGTERGGADHDIDRERVGGDGR